MYIRKLARPRVVALPDGQILSLADLPKNNQVRWVARRKLMVGQAILHGLIDAQEAFERYDVASEELQGWIKAAWDNSPKDLRATCKRPKGRVHPQTKTI